MNNPSKICKLHFLMLLFFASTDAAYSQSILGRYMNENSQKPACNFKEFKGNLCEVGYVPVNDSKCCPINTPYYCSISTKCFSTCEEANSFCYGNQVMKGVFVESSTTQTKNDNTHETENEPPLKVQDSYQSGSGTVYNSNNELIFSIINGKVYQGLGRTVIVSYDDFGFQVRNEGTWDLYPFGTYKNGVITNSSGVAILEIDRYGVALKYGSKIRLKIIDGNLYTYEGKLVLKIDGEYIKQDLAAIVIAFDLLYLTDN
jgi:hypothetical protein